MARLPSQPAFRRSLLSKLRPVDLVSPGGVFLGTRDLMLAEKTRVEAVLKKMVCGLALHHEGLQLRDAEFTFVLNPDATQWSTLDGPFNLAISDEVGDGVLRYWRAVAQDERMASMWWLLFYESVMFVAITEPRSDTTSSQSR